MSRFRPDGWDELLTRTFEMAKVEGGLYVEVIAPDLRPGALALMTVIAALGAVWRYRAPQARVASQQVASRRALVAALMSWAVAWGVWLCVSGNGRYAMALLIFIGPLLGAVVALLPVRNDWRWLLLLLLISGQILLLHSAAPSRGWAMLKQEWGEESLFPSQNDFIGPLKPDLIIMMQPQTMTAVLVNTESAKKAEILSLGFVDSLGPISAEAGAAMAAIKRAKHPVLFETYPADFIPPSDVSKLLWRRKSEEILGTYGLFVSEANCRRKLSSLNVMQIACSLSKGPHLPRVDRNSDPAVEKKMDRIIELCSKSLWPVGGRYPESDGGLVQIFRESRYIIRIDRLGVVYVKKRLDLNFVKKIAADENLDKYGDGVCALITK
ncbi:MAG: hypothetical protein EOP24_34200 [Hyphomicrobiales bacterium]|nr:MAG: hypothetical protein EOP24_34200 [Hyphomicrobiales bacterium]